MPIESAYSLNSVCAIVMSWDVEASEISMQECLVERLMNHPIGDLLRYDIIQTCRAQIPFEECQEPLPVFDTACMGKVVMSCA
jgi:hypothetical protein